LVFEIGVTVTKNLRSCHWRVLKVKNQAWYEVPFPSLDNLHSACNAIPQTRDMTAGLESGFLAVRPSLRTVLDPLTQPLSWALDSALTLFTATPWWALVPIICLFCYRVARSASVTLLVAVFMAFFLFT
jgi:glycine betaine/proline transport system permease protein